MSSAGREIMIRRGRCPQLGRVVWQAGADAGSGFVVGRRVNGDVKVLDKTGASSGQNRGCSE